MDFDEIHPRGAYDLARVKILNKIVFKIAIKFISMRNPEISYCLYSEKFK
jgi:hypothetical protein